MTAKRVVQALTVLVFAAVAFLFVRLVNPGPREVRPQIEGGAMGVERAIAVAGTTPVAVRGYVFDGPGGLHLRLCEGKRTTRPPLCLGPFLDLYQVNEGSFAMKQGSTKDGPVRWVPDPVTIRGTIVGTAMTVSEVLQ